MSGFAGLLKFLFAALLVGIVAVYVYLNRVALAAWFAGLFGDTPRQVSRARPEAGRAESSEAVRPFASFRNPVGMADAGQVVVITFQALEAWAREQGLTRNRDETPSEFVRRLASQFPVLKQHALQVVDAYNRVVYGRSAANQNDVRSASAVWDVIRPAQRS